MLVLLLLGLWVSVGALGCSLLAGFKGHDDVLWFLLGAALGPIGIVSLARQPRLVPISYLVFDGRLPELVECPSCRRVVPVDGECAMCLEPLPGSVAPGRSRLRRRLAGRHGGARRI